MTAGLALHSRWVQDISLALGALPPVFTLHQAGATGMSRHVVARAVRSGSVRRLAGGLYVVGAAWSAATLPSTQHALLARAAALHYDRAVLSHHTAAVLHGLPLPPRLPDRVAMTTDHAPTTANPTGLVRLEPGALPDEQVTAVDGVAVTTVARTVCDCLRTLALPDAVAMLDAAVGRGLTTADEVLRVRRTQARWPGATRIDLGLALHDPVRESWLESSALTDLWLLGVPLPQCQVSVHAADGRFLGRPDALWPQFGVALELDGRGKYLSGLEPHAGAPTPDDVARTVTDALLAEKHRERGLEGTGLRVERADHREATRSVQTVADRLLTAFRTHDPSGFTGSLRPHPSGRVGPDEPGPPPPVPGTLSRGPMRKGGRRRST